MNLYTNSKKKDIWRFLSKVTRYLGFATFFMVGNVHYAMSEQVAFKRTKTDTGMQFYYEWIDGEQQRHDLTFEIPFESIKNLPLRQANYKPQIAQRHVTVALTKAAKAIDPKDAKVTIKPMREAININVSGTNEEKIEDVQAHLREVQQNAYDSYLHEHYFTRFTTIFNQSAIKPDHLRYISESVKPLVSVSQAFYEKVASESDSRAYFSLILSWLQSIPYDTLEDRVVSNGSGYAPPISVLMQNLGDCDSKAVLASSMVRAFLPNTKMIVLYLPNHALLGIALTPKADDRTVEYDSSTYVLYDPTGPALIPFGEVSESTERYIVTGRYQIEVVE